MTKAIINKQNITSLELLEQINFFRREEGKKKDLRHDNLLQVIRDEFEEEIGLLKIQETPYIHPQNKQQYRIFELTLSQAKQVLVRESKFVRKAVIHKLEELENKQPKQKILSVPEFLFEQSKLMIEYDKRLNKAESKIEELEKNYNFMEYNKTCLTVSEFAEIKHLSNWEYIPKILGQKATYISKKLNLPTGKIYKHNIKGEKVKGRYFVNTYHIKALEQAFTELKIKEINNIVITGGVYAR